MTPQENFIPYIWYRWSLIAKQLPGRTDNDVKNYWNTKLRKKLQKMGIDPVTHKPILQIISDYGNIRGISNGGNQNSSFNKTLNTNFMPKPEPTSVFTERSSSSIILNPMIDQVQDNSSTSSNPSWDFMSLFQQVTTHDTMQPHFYSEASSSCSSSSSATFTQLSSPQSYSCHQSQNQITPSSPFIWSEFLLSDPVLSTDFQQQKEQEFKGMLLSTNPSTITQNDTTHCKIISRNDHQCFHRVGHEGFESCNYGAINGDQANCHADASSSFASSFVDSILDQDREMCSQFPEMLDPSFDY